MIDLLEIKFKTLAPNSAATNALVERTSRAVSAAGIADVTALAVLN